MNTLSNRWFSQRDRGRRPGKSAILGVALAFLLLFAGKGQIVHAAGITVNTTDDELNTDGDCSLREAITAANTNAAVDACAAGNAAPAVDVIGFSVMGTITLGSTLPVIGGFALPPEGVTIDGPGANSLTVSGDSAFRVFVVNVFGILNLEGVTVANGSAFIGGGVDNAGTLTITNSTFSGNSAGAGGGGAIFNNIGPLTITNSTFSGNSTSGIGGAIRNHSGQVTIASTNFSGNSAGAGGGGAIFNYIGPFTIIDSTLSGNSALGGGGGIKNIGMLTVTNTTFSGNSAGAGGGIFNDGTLTIHKSKITDNSAAEGGGIFNASGTVTLTKSKVKGNQPDNCVGC